MPARAPRFARLSTMKLPHTGQTGREGAATRGDAIGPPPTVAFHVPPPVARRRRVIQPPPLHQPHDCPDPADHHPNISTADLNSGLAACQQGRDQEQANYSDWYRQPRRDVAEKPRQYLQHVLQGTRSSPSSHGGTQHNAVGRLEQAKSGRVAVRMIGSLPLGVCLGYNPRRGHHL